MFFALGFAGDWGPFGKCKGKEIGGIEKVFGYSVVFIGIETKLHYMYNN